MSVLSKTAVTEQTEKRAELKDLGCLYSTAIQIILFFLGKNNGRVFSLEGQAWPICRGQLSLQPAGRKEMTERVVACRLIIPKIIFMVLFTKSVPSGHFNILISSHLFLIATQ